MHAAGVVALGHFLVDDAAAGRHPLDVAGGDGAVVAHAVAVLHGAGEDVGDGFDAAMGMPGEAGQVIGGDIVAEIVEEKKGIEVGGVAEAERAAQVHARAFECGLGFDELVTGRMDMSVPFWLVEARTPARAGLSDAGECSTFGGAGKGDWEQHAG